MNIRFGQLNSVYFVLIFYKYTGGGSRTLAIWHKIANCYYMVLLIGTPGPYTAISFIAPEKYIPQVFSIAVVTGPVQPV
jgi:hypothetical protein